MKKIIAGKQYDTKKAEKLGSWENTWDARDFGYVKETLYRKRTGEFFLHGEGGGNSRYGEWHGNSGGPGEKIMPLSYQAAQEWAEEHLDGDEYISIFGEPEEGKVTKAISLDSQTVAALDKMRSESGKTYGEIIASKMRKLDPELNYVAYWDDSAAVIKPTGEELRFDTDGDDGALDRAIAWANENGGIISINPYHKLAAAVPLKYSPEWVPGED